MSLLGLLGIPEDSETPLLSGRPFLAIGKTLIDAALGELILRFIKEKVVINVFKH